MIDRDIHLARALLVDGNAMMRNVTAAHLRDAGVGQVQAAGRVKEARLMLEREHFDIVLCTYHFDHCSDTGQDLLDELRRERLLPWSTVFIMVTGEATYARVAEAAESALDGYLIKPYRPTVLSERILQARRRKQELGPLLAALGAAALGSHLLAVAGAAPDDVFVVSSNGVIARRQGQVWTRFAKLEKLSGSNAVDL